MSSRMHIFYFMFTSNNLPIAYFLTTSQCPCHFCEAKVTFSDLICSKKKKLIVNSINLIVKYINIYMFKMKVNAQETFTILIDFFKNGSKKYFKRTNARLWVLNSVCWHSR